MTSLSTEHYIFILSECDWLRFENNAIMLHLQSTQTRSTY